MLSVMLGPGATEVLAASDVTVNVSAEKQVIRGFVGLMAPHIARRLVGSSYGALLPASALIGALLVLTADIVGRTLFAPVEVPAGVFTAAIGAPYFIYLLYKTRNS